MGSRKWQGPHHHAGIAATPARPTRWTPGANHRGILNGYRSGLEDKLGTQITKAGHEVRFETFKVPYVIPQSAHKYTPDFLLDNGIIVEGKGIFDSQDRAKHLLIKAQNPELDIRFVFTRAKAPISKGSKTTMADWCTKHGFQFAEKAIPLSWFHEAGPSRHPFEVLRLKDKC